MSWSFIAQRATTGEFLDWDVPLDLGALEWQLSGPGSLKATIAPDVGGLRASDGRLILEEWGTILHAESDGEIRWSGIVILSSFNDEAWEIEAAGFGSYLHRRTYRGDYTQIGVDPATVIRHIWEHVQSFPDGNLNVAVTGATDTGTRLGTDAVEEFIPPKYRAAREIRDQFKKGDGYPVYEDWTWPGCWWVVNDFNDELLDEYGGDPLNKDAAVAWLESWLDEHEDEIRRAEDADPYVLIWSEAVNCGAEVDELAKAAPLDWVEEHRWAADKESVIHEVQLHYPRVGRRRDDLIFSQGDNVSSVVPVESNGDEYANSVIGLGAGEGRSMIRRETSVRDGRLLIEHVYADKAVGSTERLDTLIAEELNFRRAAVRIESVTVIDHPNAPIGSWQIGDDVLVRADLPWLGEVEVWCRVVGWTLTGEHTATLSLIRSDLYRYGGVTA